MVEFIQFLSIVGTNEWVSGFIANNNLILTALFGGGGFGIYKRFRQGKNDSKNPK